jgi:hypothetical protein
MWPAHVTGDSSISSAIRRDWRGEITQEKQHQNKTKEKREETSKINTM